MQVSIEETSVLARRMTVGIPRERIQEEVKARLKKLARTTKLNGFRPGKVPLRVVEQRFGDQVKQEVVGEVVQQSFYEAVEQESLQLASEPQIDLDSDIQNLEEGLSYTAKFEVIPNFSNIVVDGLKVEKQVATVADADVDKMIQKLREQRLIWETVEEEGAALGHCVSVDVTVSVDGNEVEAANLEDFGFVLGQTDVAIEGFEEAVIGARIEEVVEVDLKCPDGYVVPELAGREAHFSIFISDIERGRLPEINEEFAKALGVESGDVNTLLQDVRDNMARELEYVLKNRIKQQTLDALLELNPSEVPEALIKNEAQRIANDYQREMLVQGRTNVVDIDLTHFNEQAEKRVRSGLLMAALVNQNDIQPDASKVHEMLDRIASAYEEPESVIEWYYSDVKRLADVESMVLEEQVVDWLLEKADITEIETTFDAVMNPA